MFKIPRSTTRSYVPFYTSALQNAIGQNAPIYDMYTYINRLVTSKTNNFKLFFVAKPASLRCAKIYLI